MMLPGNDVLNVEAEERLIGFVQAAILAALSGSAAHEPPNRSFHADCPLRPRRIRACSLEDGHEVVDQEVRLIFPAFLRCEFALVAFVREFGDTGLHLAVSLQAGDFVVAGVGTPTPEPASR